MIINFFEFYNSFDKFAYSFEEIDQCWYNIQLVNQIWKKNSRQVSRKEYYLWKFKMNTIIWIKKKKLDFMKNSDIV
jgi:hypothetical protein